VGGPLLEGFNSPPAFDLRLWCPSVVVLNSGWCDLGFCGVVQGRVVIVHTGVRMMVTLWFSNVCAYSVVRVFDGMVEGCMVMRCSGYWGAYR
jgi:hypothetical protein